MAYPIFQMTSLPGPHFPLGYDTGLGADEFEIEGGPQLLDFDNMQDFDLLESWSHLSPNEPVSAAAYPPDATSPGAKSHHAASGGSSSLSPSVASLILTPTSTLLDYQDSYTHEDPASSDNVSSSPESNDSQPDGFVHVTRMDGEPSGGNRRLNRPPPHSSGAHFPTLPSQQSSTSRPTQATQNGQWLSFTSSSSSGMDYHRTPSFIPYTSSTELDSATDTSLDDEVFSFVGGFDNAFSQGQLYSDLPFRNLDDGSGQEMPSSFPDTTLLSQQAPSFRQQASNTTSYLDQGFIQPHFDVRPTFGTAQQYPSGFNAQDFAYQSAQPNHTTLQTSLPQSILISNQQRASTRTSLNTTVRPSVSPASAHRGQYVQQQQQVQAQSNRFPQLENRSSPANNHSPTSTHTEEYNSSSSFGSHTKRVIYNIVKAEPSHSHVGPVRTSQSDRVRKGGRSRGGHLPEQSRAKSHEMRKVGACWRCAMQRDPCDHGDPCSRCTMRSQRGQQYFFDCDRSKLPDFVYDFLPPSMTLMHQKQSIEDTVSEQVLGWDQQNGIDVYLSSGYGPPLRWKLYEFIPRTDELLNQLQFFQDVKTKQSRSTFKYSPPLGLLKIDTSDDAHFEQYLDQLLEPEHLWDFGWSCYEEETLADEDAFQAKLLDLLCKLYISTKDQSLHTLLRDILRMMIITFIMGHTLTISQQTAPAVLLHIRSPTKPPSLAKHTSPRLANRQLKFFFSVLRNNIYEKILKWQQQTLHTAGKKDTTWLQAFCVMLGFACVLEEVQRTILIQADASVQKGEMTIDNANAQAYNACERIDARFKLLVGLFQCKYRDRKWGEHGSFGNGTPELRDPASREFLRSLRSMLVQRYEHLKSREDVPIRTETQCLFTTRLTARFLLPFLNLPAT